MRVEGFKVLRFRGWGWGFRGEGLIVQVSEISGTPRKSLGLLASAGFEALAS